MTGVAVKRYRVAIEITASEAVAAELRHMLPGFLNGAGCTATSEIEIKPIRAFAADRFWPKVHKTDNCWYWVGHLESNGYGKFFFGGKMEWAHRVAWLLEHGMLRRGEQVLHHCDNPRCVRPDHLFTGTQRDNARDMAAKGRAALQRYPSLFQGDRHWTHRHPERVRRGEQNFRAKLTDAQVVEIREWYDAGGRDYRTLASRYGVHHLTISRIARRVARA